MGGVMSLGYWDAGVGYLGGFAWLMEEVELECLSRTLNLSIGLGTWQRGLGSGVVDGGL